MPQSQILEQRQEQRQVQTISGQQLLQAQLVEMPIQQLMERVRAEMDTNEALEPVNDDLSDGFAGTADSDDSSDESDDFDTQREREERSDALDAALEGIGRDDEELPVHQGSSNGYEENEPAVFADSVSFYDYLLEQVGELEQTERDRYVMEYLIRSLDDDGMLRTPLTDIREHLAIYDNIDIDEAELETILHRMQQLDPAGIGARSLQECLLLQIERRPDSRLKELMQTVVNDYFSEFTKKHWDRIQQQLSLTDLQTDTLLRELRRLNPKPGASMGETIGRAMQQITPDFIVDTQDDGTVTFTLNNGELPRLEVSQSYADLIHDYQTNRENMSRQQKEALLYTKRKVDAAQGFIDAVQTRRRTLTKTMRAIIQLQHRFFEEGDESLLRPMILKDINKLTGLDLSTISRVTNAKYVQTRWGTFPLKYFFSDAIVTQNGEELSTREIKSVLRELIDNEDKRKPLSDDALSKALQQRGYPVARRTVAKYREQLGLPIARLRR